MTHRGDAWDTLGAQPPSSFDVGGVRYHVGQRVRLQPRPGGDIMDVALAGRVATILSIDVTTDDQPHFSVVVDDDPGRDLGSMKYPGHRFYFGPNEIAPLEALDGSDNVLQSDNVRQSDFVRPRILVAGIGNIFFGDDGFGVAVVRRLSAQAAIAGVTIRDFGIRGLDLAFALRDYDVAILVDAMSRGGAPGTVYLVEVEPSPPDGEGLLGASVDAHGLDPARVLRLARSLGSHPSRVLVLGCEPATVDERQSIEHGVGSLSPRVSAAVDEAVRMIDALVRDTTLRSFH